MPIVKLNTGGALVVQELLELGVETVYGLPGVHTLELYESLREYEQRLRHITITQEVSAAHMADGYGRTTGRPGVLLVVPGPGITNALTGLLESNFDCVPVLMITAFVSNPVDGFRFHSHECDLTAALGAVCKAVHTVGSRSEIRATIKKAYEETTMGRPGPVAVQIQFNLLDATEDLTVTATSRIGVDAALLASDWMNEPLDEVVALLSSRRTILYLGAGCNGSVEEIRWLQEKLQCPFSTTSSGKGLLPETHPFSLGFGFGCAGTEALERAYDSAELVLALGCQFSEFATGSYSGLRDPARRGDAPMLPIDLVHVNIEPSHLVADKSHFFDVANVGKVIGIAADTKQFLAALQDRLFDHSLTALWNVTHQDPQNAERSAEAVSPSWFFSALNTTICDKGLGPPLFSTDAGEHQLWAVQSLTALTHRSFLVNSNNQSMGYAIPAMLGAKFQFPERWGFTIVGDGSYLYTGMELLNASQEKVRRLVVFVFRDGLYAEIALFQNYLTSKPYGITVPQYDLEKLAAAIGLPYFRIQSEVALESAMATIIEQAETSTVLVECNIRYPTIFDSGQAMLRERFTKSNTPRRKRDGSLAGIAVRRFFLDPLGSIRLILPKKP
jgi:acetolactate synthase-1/2/3 large subunit